MLAVRLLVVEDDAVHNAMGVSALLYSLFCDALDRSHAPGMRSRPFACAWMQPAASSSLQARESRYRNLAHHDTLTGLPNRLSLEARMPELLKQVESSGGKLALIYIDLDHFKDINDTRGHRCGDAGTHQCGETLARVSPPTTWSCEWVATSSSSRPSLLCSRSASPALADDLATSIELPLLHDGEVLETSASMGIAVYPDHGDDSEQLLKNADIALYQAKAAGRGNHKFFVDEDARGAPRAHLPRARWRRRSAPSSSFSSISLLIHLASGRLIGVEALLRWRHPERGLVPPQAFIPIAEQCGLIDTLGREVVQKVCRQLRDWQRAGVPARARGRSMSRRRSSRRRARRSAGRGRARDANLAARSYSSKSPRPR